MAGSLDILVLCTGNICRSPMAEGMLQAKLAERGVAATVSSAGLSFDGRPATEEAAAVAEAFGVDITGHSSRVLLPGHLAADLIIAMERFHLREAVVLDSSVLARCFTLKELVRRGEATGARRADETLERWLARVGSGRRLVELLGESPEDDIADPYLMTIDDYVATGDELDGLLTRLVDLAWPHSASREVAS